MHQVIVVGSGPAGLTAAIYLARARLDPLLLEGPSPGGQLTTAHQIGNFPGFPEPLTGGDLMEAMRQQAIHHGATCRIETVEAVDLSTRPFRLTTGTGTPPLETRALILATGATARYLDLEACRQLIGRGVSGCATCDGMFYRDVPVAVVGGGDSAIDEALFLTRFASKVYLIHRRDELRASTYMAEQAHRHEKIEILWNRVVADLRDVEKGQLEHVLLKDVNTGQTHELAIQGLFMGIGHDPCTRLVRGQLDLDPDGYIRTRSSRTSTPGVFAAGDVQDPVYRQAITAAASGCIAAIETEQFLRHEQD